MSCGLFRDMYFTKQKVLKTYFSFGLYLTALLNTSDSAHVKYTSQYIFG